MVALGDFAEFVRGINFKPDDVVAVGTPETVACMRTKNVQSSLDLSDVWAVHESFMRREDQCLQEGDILVSSANSWNLVGKCSWIPALPYRATFGGFVSVLRASSSKLDRRYLYRWFSSEYVQETLRSFGQKTTNISNLNIGRCERLQLPLPPLEEQRRIAAILDQAETLRTQRRHALAHLDTLTQSLFLDMFGDPVANGRGWPRVPFGSLLEKIESGWSPVCLDRPAEGDEWAVLKLGAVTSCQFKPLENKALPDSVVPDASIEVKSGDLLFSRKNTYELVAACVLVDEAPPRLMMSDLIFRFRLNSHAQVNCVYLHRLLVHPSKRQEVQKLAGGSSSSMPNISKAKLAEFLIEVPPLALQQTFATRIQAIEALKATHRTALAQLDALFASLQQRAFAGEL